MEKDKLQAYVLYTVYLGQNDILAELLCSTFLQSPGLIYQVFILKDEADRLDLANKFILSLTYSEMQSLVKGNSSEQNNQGLFLLKWIYKWLDKDTSPNSMKLTNLNFMLFNDLVRDTDRSWNLSIEPRRLTESEIADYKEKPGGDNFDMDIIWELPISGLGFEVYNRNDVASDGLDQIGTYETVMSIKAIAGVWNQQNPNSLIYIGDLSRPGGLDTSQHKGHEDGKIFDMRPLRNDTSSGPLTINSSSYSRDLTTEFIRLVKQLHPSVYILFNDSEIAGQGEFTYVHMDSGHIHDNHLHLEFR